MPREETCASCATSTASPTSTPTTSARCSSGSATPSPRTVSIQLEMTRRTSWGTVSRGAGPGLPELDRDVRRTGYTRAGQSQAQIARLAPEYRTMLEAYADGVNDVIDAIAAGKVKLPADFKRVGLRPARWTAADVAPDLHRLHGDALLGGQRRRSRRATRPGSQELTDAASAPRRRGSIFDDLITSRGDRGDPDHPARRGLARAGAAASRTKAGGRAGARGHRAGPRLGMRAGGRHRGRGGLAAIGGAQTERPAAASACRSSSAATAG